MRIGIDISQIVYEGTGVAAYVRNMVHSLVKKAPHHTFILFGASLRKRSVFEEFAEALGSPGNVRLVSVPLPPTVLDVLWNRLHVIAIETFTGPLDMFWSSDWTQPPLSKAAGITTVHDLSIFMESRSMDGHIVSVQTRRLARAVSECRMFLCDSEATKKDVKRMYNIPDSRVNVVYPGFSVNI